MIKKIMLFSLIVAFCLISASIPAAAINNSGSVGFKVVQEVPPGPSDKTIPGIHNVNGIDFGNLSITSETRVYRSVEQARGDESNQYAGLVVESYGVGGEIQLEISPFTYQDAGLRSQYPTVMSGFSMKLTPGTIIKEANTPGNPALCSAATNTYVADVPQIIFALPDNNVGVFGVNYAGELTVPGDSSVIAGELQAVMTWTTVVEATP